MFLFIRTVRLILFSFRFALPYPLRSFAFGASLSGRSANFLAEFRDVGGLRLRWNLTAFAARGREVFDQCIVKFVTVGNSCSMENDILNFKYRCHASIVNDS